MTGGRLAGAALGLLADRALGEPPDELHPVAGFGWLMGRLEDELWADDRGRGAAYAGVGTALGLVAGRTVGSTGPAVAVAAAGRMLRGTATEVGDLLNEDVDAAREALPALVGRDPSGLDQSGIAAAVVESVAENTVDAVVAPAFWGAVAGPSGALAHRAVNTLDAMVGHHNDRYEHFGWASARADDIANWVPARLTAALVLAAEPAAAGRAVASIRAGASHHPSPNSGVAEAAFAGALGIELGGPLRYGSRHEDRPRLGTGPRPGVEDIRRAVALENRVELLLVALLGLGAGLAWWRR